MKTTLLFVSLTLGLFLSSWAAYDLYVVKRYGLESGKTISWAVFEKSKQQPAIPFLTGLTIGLLCGHFFLQMPK